MTVAERIRMLCARLNISQAELARRIGQSPQVSVRKQIGMAVSCDYL